MSKKADIAMFDLAEAGYPILTISRQALPFSKVDVGDVFKLVGTVKLTSIMEQGNTYNFQLQQVGFPAKEAEIGTIKSRKETKQKANEEGL